MFDPTKPVQTRDGRKAEIWKVSGGFIYGGVPYPDGGYGQRVWWDNGRISKSKESAGDLVNVSPWPLNTPLKTRDGREAWVFMTDGGGIYPLIGAIEDESGEWEEVTWREDGKYRDDRGDGEDLLPPEAA